MTQLSYPQIRAGLDDLADAAPKYGYKVQSVIDSDDTWMATWANADLYVIVSASIGVPETGPRTLIDIHAGGAYRATPSQQLFETLCTASGYFDFGGPWARTMPNGLATYGWRSRYPSELFTDGNYAESFGFTLGMIDAFGAAAGKLANDLIPISGGRVIRADDPNAFQALLAGMLPPQHSQTDQT